MIVKIKDKLRGNVKEITRVLESLEFHKIHFYQILLLIF